MITELKLCSVFIYSLMIQPSPVLLKTDLQYGFSHSCGDQLPGQGFRGYLPYLYRPRARLPAKAR